MKPTALGHGDTIPPYSPVREIARGGMGSVLVARDNKLGRSVAMKVMLRRNASEEEQQRFLQEARILGQLEHPNINPIYDVGTDEQGQPFYTMKLVRGVTLHEVIGKLKAGDKETLAQYPLNALLTIFQKVCEAVAFAHSCGIIHRDLKPQNIMVGEGGQSLVMDWGLAKILPGSPAAEAAANALPFQEQFRQAGPSNVLPWESAAPARGKAVDIAAFSETVADGAPSVPPAAAMPGVKNSAALSAVTADSAAAAPATTARIAATLDGAVVGTAHYMSPEQAQGRVNELDARSDIYSLGGILYTLLTLRPPMEGKTLDEVLEKVRTGSFTPPSTVVAPGSSTSLKPQGSVLAAAKIEPLPHISGGSVPAALSAVVMKALHLDKARRYQSVAALSAEVAAYQGGFTTASEEAGACTRLMLLMRRHRAVSTALAVLLLSSVGFGLSLRSSEREAKRLTGIAQTNERQGNPQREAARQALAKPALALAEAALQAGKGLAMRAALQQVPADLRDTRWSYLFEQANTLIARVKIGAAALPDVTACPRRPEAFALAETDRKVTPLELPRPGPRFAMRLAFSTNAENIALTRGARGCGDCHTPLAGRPTAQPMGPALDRTSGVQP